MNSFTINKEETHYKLLNRAGYLLNCWFDSCRGTDNVIAKNYSHYTYRRAYE